MAGGMSASSPFPLSCVDDARGPLGSVFCFPDKRLDSGRKQEDEPAGISLGLETRGKGDRELCRLVPDVRPYDGPAAQVSLLNVDASGCPAEE